jgi:hypothetical protein
LSLGVGMGFIRLGGAGGSGDCRRRAEGLMIEFCRILVPYECWAEVVGGTRALLPRLGWAVATIESIARWTLMGRTIIIKDSTSDEGLRVVMEELEGEK